MTCDLKRRLIDKESDSLLQTSSCTGSSSFAASFTAKSGSQAGDKPHQKRHVRVGHPQTSDMNTRSENTVEITVDDVGAPLLLPNVFRVCIQERKKK